MENTDAQLQPHEHRAPEYCICRDGIRNDLCPQHGYKNLPYNCVVCGAKVRREVPK